MNSNVKFEIDLDNPDECKIINLPPSIINFVDILYFVFKYKYLKCNEAMNLIFLNKKIYYLYINNRFLENQIIVESIKNASSYSPYYDFVIPENLNNYQKCKWLLYTKMKQKYRLKGTYYSTKNPVSIYEVCTFIFNYQQKFHNDIWEKLNKTKQIHKEKEEIYLKNGNWSRGYTFHSLSKKEMNDILTEIVQYY
jgi:hypothetical protein